MTELQAMQREALAMLREIDRICRAHGIAYQLAAGTLLGAVRHGGFIPWDDDIDICLRRRDYERFLALAPAALGTRHRVRHRGTDASCAFLFCKVERRAEMGLSEGAGAAFVDVFPFDNVGPGPVRGRVQMRLAQVLVLMLAHADGGAERPPARPRGILRRMAIALFVGLSRRLGRERLAAALARVAGRHAGRESGHVACLVAGRMRYRFMRAASAFDDCIDMSFEGQAFPVPREYDRVLRNLYGDYRVPPPTERRRPHHIDA